MSTNLHFNQVASITLIGGGNLMAESALIFAKQGFAVNAIIAPRHIDEPLIGTKATLGEYLAQNDIHFSLISDINQLTSSELAQYTPSGSMAICYGPAWVFKQHVIHAFEYGMYNINPIPIPHYLGGAHYTWQILNQNREGGCVLQMITEQLDQGGIIAKHQFEISTSAKTPDDYFVENIEQGLVFIEQLAIDFKNGKAFMSQSYHDTNKNRVYLPRLRTDKQAYINWQWHRDEIISFCRAFSAPYAGAATFANQQELRITEVEGIELEHLPMHPFAAGVIIRKLNNEIVVAAVGGFIKITALEPSVYQQLKEGTRLFTPASILDQAMQYQVVLTAEGFKD